MCLYLFSNAHTSINASDLKILRNIMVKLNCYINVTTGCKILVNQCLATLDGNAMYWFGQ